MQQVNSISKTKQIPYGLYSDVARQMGCSSNYVRLILNNKRAIKSEKSKNILHMALKLKKQYEKDHEKIQSKLNQL